MSNGVLSTYTDGVVMSTAFKPHTQTFKPYILPGLYTQTSPLSSIKPHKPYIKPYTKSSEMSNNIIERFDNI
jgi:hypothetical protein